MIKRHPFNICIRAICGALILAAGASAAGAADIEVIASDDPQQWKSSAGTFQNGTLTLPVRPDDVLIFKFDSGEDRSPHGITTVAAPDAKFIQKRKDPGGHAEMLQELGTGDTRVGIRIDSKAPSEEITQLKVLGAFNGELKLKCAVHSGMKVTLKQQQ